MFRAINVQPVFRAVNRVGRALQALGFAELAFDPQGLLAQARHQAQLDDFALDGRFVDALETLCHSLEHDAQLHFVGRVILRRRVLLALENRLRYVSRRRSEPQIAETALRSPVIVVGLPRTGTTLLHRLLALAPDARALAGWQLYEPIASPRSARRRASVTRMFRVMGALDPTLSSKHHLAADNPEECMVLLDATLLTWTFWVFAPAHSYRAWLAGQDLAPSYTVYRWYLQYFQRLDARRLVLKAPAHTAALPALRDAVPEACIVQCHRDPEDVIPSFSSLTRSLHGLTSDRLDVARMTEGNIRHLELMAAQSDAVRARPGHNIVDVAYDELVADPVACVRRIHRRFGLAFEPDHAVRIAHYVATHRADAYGTHRYTAADFATTRQAIRARFAGYRERYVRVPDSARTAEAAEHQ